MEPLKKLIRLLGPLSAQIRQIYFLALAQGAFYLMVPLGIQAIVTYTMAGRLSASLILLCCLTIVAVIFIGIFQLWQMRVNETLQQNILALIGVRFAKSIATLPAELYRDNHLKAYINHFFDVLTLQKGLSKFLLDVSFSLISIMLGLIILSAYNPLFMLFTLVTGIAFYLIVRTYGNRSMQSSYRESSEKYQFVEDLQQLFLDGESKNTDSVDRTKASLERYIKEKAAHFRNLDVQYRSVLIFKIVFTAFTLFTGIWLVQTGSLNIGQFVASEILVIMIINAIEKLVLSLKTVYDVLTAVQKLYAVLELPQQQISDELTHFEHHLKRIGRFIYSQTYNQKIKRLVYSILIIGGVTMFLPWNQTVNSSGAVTVLDPSGKPQVVSSRISGRIEKWFVLEGQRINKGDTIAFISEVKDDYFDPGLVDRTQSQVRSKESGILAYEKKVNAIDAQIYALNDGFRLRLQQSKNKLQQAKVKVTADSIEYQAYSTAYKISEEQFSRYEKLLHQGVISRTDYENRKTKLQEGLSKRANAENKWMNSKNEAVNASIELSAIKQEYNEKLMKAESDKFATLSSLYDAEASLTKMQNQLSNYDIRSGYYYITAPQDGFIMRSFVQGMGDIVKEGAPLVSMVPVGENLSAELYIEPMDLALIRQGMDVQLTFDGWPAFVFSGWPGVSFGTYSAKVVAIDKVISPNGKFRVLVTQNHQQWPIAVQQGSGVKGLFLLDKVIVIYEIWRKINGFPPEYYQSESSTSNLNDEKK
jgi:multidrug resistance efflux pump